MDHFRAKHFRSDGVIVKSFSISSFLLTCDLCGKHFTTRESLLYHMKLCHLGRKVGKDHPEIDQLPIETVIRSHIQNEEPTSKNPPKKSSTLKICQECGQVFPNQQEWNQ